MEKEREDLIYGRHTVQEALASGQPVDKVFLQQGTRGEFEKELRNSCKFHEVPFTIIPQAKLGRMTRGNHQAVIAQLAMKSVNRRFACQLLLLEAIRFCHFINKTSGRTRTLASWQSWSKGER